MELRSDQIKRGVARAPHRSLLKADGAYAALYHTQLSRQDS